MPIIVYNLSWMTYNTLLALIPVILGTAILFAPKEFIRYLIIPFWLAFLPNTLYLLTDLIHLPEDLTHVSGIETGVILFMYIFLVLVGFATYILACKPVIDTVKGNTFFIIFMINTLIGVGLVLGRVFRFNSWDIFYNPGSILHFLFTIITSVSHISLILLFALFTTLFYYKVSDLFFRIK